MSARRSLTRGAIAARTGVNAETVRYYERIGLLPPPPRSAGGHRLYDDTLLRRLNFIRRCRELGFSLVEVRSLLRLADGDDASCREVEALTAGHLEEVRGKIAALQRLEAVLADMVAQCAGGEVPTCPVLEALFTDQP